MNNRATCLDKTLPEKQSHVKEAVGHRVLFTWTGVALFPCPIRMWGQFDDSRELEKAGGKRAELVGLGGIPEHSQGAVSGGSSSALMWSLYLVFVSLSYVHPCILLVAVPECHQSATW